MGLSSLVFVVAGYGAGRLRELRDPQAAVVPMIVGAAATAVTTFGFGLMNFMLGIDAPVSFLLLRQILATIVLNALIALPVFAIVRRWLSPVLPEDPRRRRRRAYTTGGPVAAEPRLMPVDPTSDRRPPITPQLALRVAGVGVVAFVLFGIVFFRLWYLQVLDGDKYLAQARENRVRTERIQAPRGQIVDRNNLTLVDNRKRDGRLASTRAASRSTLRTRSPPTARACHGARQAAEGQAGPAAARCRRRPGRPQTLLPAPGQRAADVARDDQPARGQLDPPGALRQRADQDRRRPPPSATTSRSTRSASRASAVEQVYLRTTRSATSPPSSRQRRPDHRARSSRTRPTRGSRRARSSARAAWSPSTTSTCAATTATYQHRGQRGRRAPPGRRRARARARPRAQADARPRAPAGRASRHFAQAGGGHPGAFVAINPTRRRDLRDGLLPDVTTRATLRRAVRHPGRLRPRSSARPPAAPAVQPRRSAAPIRPARSSSRSRRWPPCDSRRHHARQGHRRHGLHHGRRARGRQGAATPARKAYGPVNLRRRAARLVRHLLLHLGKR